MLKFARQTIADLECVIAARDLEQKPEGLVVLCHGYGAPGTDLVPCAPELYTAEPAAMERVWFVFPAAPMRLDAEGLIDGRAWWPVDMARLQMMIVRDEFRDMRHTCPELLPQRRQAITQLLEVLCQSFELQMSQVILGGFSQGAMLTTDVALHLEHPPAGLLVWSGCLLCEKQWRPLIERRGPMRVLITHGSYDPILPAEGSAALRDLFEASGNSIEFHSFPGEHTIPAVGIEAGARLIASALASET